MKIWQQSGGDGDRNYIDICLKWGVILNGPSWLGEWTSTAREEYRKAGISSRKCTDLDRFAREMSDGDVVVLRLGTREIYGVGIISEDYTYHDAFIDVDGWDIAHVRRVKWIWSNSKEPKVFDTYALNQGDTTQLLPDNEKSAPVRQWINTVAEGVEPDRIQLPALPHTPIKSISFLEVCKPLYDCGLSARSVSEVHNRMSDLSQLAQWYRSYSSGVSEAETVSQLVTPLLSALGWSPQTTAMEWSPTTGGRIDLAAFRPFRGKARQDDDIVLIVEAKRFDSSCLKGFDQVQNYSVKLKNCDRCVVTDGMRYAIFVRDQHSGKFEDTPRAYLNLLNPKDSYPIMECDGADEALLLLSPNWHPRLMGQTQVD